MRARICASSAVVLAFSVVAMFGTSALAQPNDLQYAMQLASCPTILPAEEGERSIIVPNEAPNVATPPQQVPRVASLPKSPEQDAAQAQLKEKLAQRDQLQREIAALRESTKTPEQILVRFQMLEFNLTRMRQLGLDLGFAERNFQVVESGKTFQDISAALQARNLGKVLAEPLLVTLSGRPAAFHVGGEVPIPTPGAAEGFKFQPIGTQLDVLAESLGENRVRVQVRPRISEISGQNAIVVNGQQVPAFSVRQVDTSTETEFGKTVVISGLVQNRAVASKDAAGNLHDEVDEIALVVLVSPEIVR